jgi:hypothetical protein
VITNFLKFGLGKILIACLATEKKQAKLSLGLKFIIVIRHFRFTGATNFPTLTGSMNMRCVVGKEQATLFCFVVSCLFCEYPNILEVDVDM